MYRLDSRGRSTSQLITLELSKRSLPSHLRPANNHYGTNFQKTLHSLQIIQDRNEQHSFDNLISLNWDDYKKIATRRQSFFNRKVVNESETKFKEKATPIQVQSLRLEAPISMHFLI